MAVASTSTAGAAYTSKDLAWWQAGASGNNVSAFGGRWNYSMTRAYQAQSGYNHSSCKHRVGVYTPKTSWVFSSTVNKNTYAYIARYQANSYKAVSCARY